MKKRDLKNAAAWTFTVGRRKGQKRFFLALPPAAFGQNFDSGASRVFFRKKPNHFSYGPETENQNETKTNHRQQDGQYSRDQRARYVHPDFDSKRGFQ